MKNRSKHPAEFREKVVREAIETNNVKAVAERYELQPSLVYGWKQAYLKKSAEKSTKSKKDYEKLLSEKEAEIEILRELLKKRQMS